MALKVNSPRGKSLSGPAPCGTSTTTSLLIKRAKFSRYLYSIAQLHLIPPHFVGKKKELMTSPPPDAGHDAAGAAVGEGGEKGERDRLRSRVFHLEKRLRETEEELKYYLDFYKEAKRDSGQEGEYGTNRAPRGARDGSTNSTSYDSSSGSSSGGGGGVGRIDQTRKDTGAVGKEGSGSDDLNSGSDGGMAPVNQNYTGERKTTNPLAI